MSTNQSLLFSGIPWMWISPTSAGTSGSSRRPTTTPTFAWANATSPCRTTSTPPTTPRCRVWCTTPTSGPCQNPVACPRILARSVCSIWMSTRRLCWKTTRIWWLRDADADSPPISPPPRSNSCHFSTSQKSSPPLLPNVSPRFGDVATPRPTAPGYRGEPDGPNRRGGPRGPGGKGDGLSGRKPALNHLHKWLYFCPAWFVCFGIFLVLLLPLSTAIAVCTEW